MYMIPRKTEVFSVPLLEHGARLFTHSSVDKWSLMLHARDFSWADHIKKLTEIVVFDTIQKWVINPQLYAFVPLQPSSGYSGFIVPIAKIKEVKYAPESAFFCDT